jgi:NAD(P)-dependent dehydrogenase (short-subunit alcohol dehydrogenase family)
VSLICDQHIYVCISSCRIINVASIGQLFQRLDLNDLMSTHTKTLGFLNALPYFNSKFANSLFTRELAKRMLGSVVKTYSVCPGIVRTPFFRTTPKFPFLHRLLCSITVLIMGLSPKVVSLHAIYHFISHGVANMITIANLTLALRSVKPNYVDGIISTQF